jgi:predicted RNA-binding Zn-ribbon protein involved in translation (DUF1610 family)
MTELVNCIECQHTLSAMATACPQCNTQWPRGRRCTVCGKIGKDEEGVGYTCSDSEGYSYQVWMDFTCRKEIENEVLAVKFTCPVCNTIQTPRIETRNNFAQLLYSNSCANCGQPLHWLLDRRECYHCMVEILRSHAVLSCAHSALEAETYKAKCMECKLNFGHPTNPYTRHFHRTCLPYYIRRLEAASNNKKRGCLSNTLIIVILLVATSFLLFK